MKKLILLAIAVLFATVAHAQTQTIIVSPGANTTASGTNLLNAVAGITGNSWGNRFVVKIEPGVYDLGTTPLQMKEWVDIEGSGRDQTWIWGTGLTTSDWINSGPSGPRGTINGAANAELRDLTVRSRDADYTLAIATVNGADLSVHNVTVKANTGTSGCWGIRSTNADVKLENVSIRVECASNYNSGFSSRNTSRPSLEDVDIRSFGGSIASTNIGAYMDGAALPVLFKDVSILTGDSTAGGHGIHVGPNTSGNLYFAIVGSRIAAGIDGTAIVASSGSGAPSIDVMRSELIGNHAVNWAPSGSLRIQHSVVSTTSGQVFSGLSIAPRLASTHFNDSTGATGIAAIPGIFCASLWDNAYTFYPNTCPP
ncbi:MAG: hypothetical protein AAGD38_12840 [Acidobacteriota bacterium]